MNTNNWIEKNLPVITLIIATLSLIIAIAGFLGIGNPIMTAPAPAPKASGMGGGRGGMGGGPGMGMMAPRETPPALKAALDQRIALLRKNLELTTAECKTGKLPQSALWQARYALDEALLMKERSGGRRMMAGASEAFLKAKLTARIAASDLPAAEKNAAELAANQAEIALIQSTMRLRNKEAFDAATAALENYPADAGDELVLALYQAETGK